MRRLLALLLALTVWTGTAQAHALEPGFLDLRIVGDTLWRVVWRKPDVQGAPMAIDPVFSADCTEEARPEPRFDGAAWSARWTLRCPGGLAGTDIRIDGLEATRTDVLVRYEPQPGQSATKRLVPDEAGFAVPVDPGPAEVLASYFGLGVEHILFGIDHLLFVLALVLLIPDRRSLIWAITAFTVAHSITLGAAALGWLAVPGPPVEAFIALSIVFVAAEVLRRDPANPGLSERAPWLVSFGFGLIHGLGFGSALTEIGLPENEIVLALLAFNLGVEAGQLLFIAAVLAVGAVAGRIFDALSARRLETGLVYGIGGVAAFWLFERLTGF